MDLDLVKKIGQPGYFLILGVMTAITVTTAIASIAISIFTGVYLAVLCSEEDSITREKRLKK